MTTYRVHLFALLWGNMISIFLFKKKPKFKLIRFIMNLKYTADTAVIAAVLDVSLVLNNNIDIVYYYF